MIGELCAAGANFGFTLVIKTSKTDLVSRLQRLSCTHMKSVRWGREQKHNFAPPRYCQGVTAPLAPESAAPGVAETTVVMKFEFNNRGRLHL